MKSKTNLRNTCFAVFVSTIGTSGFSTAQPIIECCSDVFYLENVGSGNQPAGEIYADEVYVSTDACFPGGGDVEITSPVNINGGAITLLPGTTYTSGTLVASGGCNESTAYSYYSSHAVQKLLVPNVFTPNGDGINDFYMMNVNNAKYYVVRVWQQINGNMQEIYYAEGDVVCNWPVLWDGITGVNFSSFANQNMFAIDFAFSNCYAWDNNAEDNRVWVAVFRSGQVTDEELEEQVAEMKPLQNLQWLGTDEQLMSESFSVAPNPSSGKFTVSCDYLDQSSEIEILDLRGRVIDIEPDRSKARELSFDLSQEPKGVYLLRFIHNGAVHVERLILD